MSAAVLLIAAVPASAVLAVGAFTHSKSWTTIAAIAMAVLGVMTGSPMFVATDLFFVGGAYWLTMRTIDHTAGDAIKKGVRPKPFRSSGDVLANATLRLTRLIGFLLRVAVGAAIVIGIVVLNLKYVWPKF